MIQVEIKTQEELEALKVTELKALCKKYEFDGYGALAKSELVASLLDFFSNIDSFEGFMVVQANQKEVVFSRPVRRHNVMTWR